MSGDWVRVGQKVRVRRIELDIKTATALAAKAGLSSRLVGGLERGSRDSYSPSTKLLIERALNWSVGDLDRIAEGAEPTPTSSVKLVKDRLGTDRSEPRGNGLGDPHVLNLLQSALDVTKLALQRVDGLDQLTDGERQSPLGIGLALAEGFQKLDSECLGDGVVRGDLDGSQFGPDVQYSSPCPACGAPSVGEPGRRAGMDARSSSERPTGGAA